MAHPWSMIKDSFQSFLSGLGMAGRDKGASSSMMWILNQLDRPQLEAAYRSDWIARKAVDIPAFDSTRQWRAWQADNDQIEAIEDLERELNVQYKLGLGMRKARLYGGAALIIGVDAGDVTQELNIEQVKLDSLKWLHVVASHELSCEERISDITSPWFGQPKFYERRLSNDNSQVVRIHPSRVVRLCGLETPDDSVQLNGPWGDPVLQMVQDAVKGAGATIGSIAHLISEAKIDIVKVPNLTEVFANKESEDGLVYRMSAANAAKSNINALLFDKEEDWQRIQVNLAGMPEIMQMFLMIVSGAVDVPVTRFLGQSPTGLNATGESDTRNYYDRLASEQTTVLQPALSILDEVIIRSALGSRDDNIHYKWNSLWQMTDQEKADLQAKKAAVVKIDNDSGLIPITAMAKIRQNQLIEDGFYPGIEEALQEAEAAGDIIEPEPPPDPNLPLVNPNTGRPIAGQPPVRMLPPAMQPQRALPRPRASADARRRRLQDAQPRALYVRRDLVNVQEFTRWAKSQGFTDVLEDLHTTLIYSREPVDWMKMGSDWGIGNDDKGKLRVGPGGPRLVERLGDQGAVVLLFSSSALSWRHEDMVRNGASHDYEEFTPHVTITYSKPVSLDLADVEPYRGELIFGPEIFEAITNGGS